MKKFTFLMTFLLSSFSFAADVETHYSALSIASQACRDSNPGSSNCAHDPAGYVYSWVTVYKDFDQSTYTANLFCGQVTLGGNDTCTSNLFHYGSTCPSGQSFDASGQCQSNPCEPGSLSPDCRVTCPVQEYTYFQNGIARSGRIGGGTVGYGQSCPQPSYPPGSSSGCVGSPGTCADYEAAIPEGVPIVIEETSTSGTEGSDGSSTSSGGTSTSTSGGGSSTESTGGSSTGTNGIDSNGNLIDPTSINNEGAPSDLSDNQIELGGETYQLCNDGSVANSSTGCDYTSNSCGPNQIDTVYGCFDLPNPEPPPDSLPGSTTTTTTSAPIDNGDGTTTTTTTTTTVTTGGVTDGEPTDEQSTRSASGSSNCDVPPTCSGDAIDCALLVQEWKTTCNAYESSTSTNDCEIPPTCEGDPIECALLQQQYDQYCATEKGLDNAVNDAVSYFTDQNMDDLGTLSNGALLDQILTDDSEVDVEDELGSFFNFTAVGGSCPQPEQVNLGQFGTVEFSYQLFCDLASIIRYLVLLGAYYVGGTIVLRSFTYRS